MRVEVRSVAPDANPYMVMYSIFKTGLDGETAKIKNLRQAERYLPDNIYNALENFRSQWTTTILGEDVKGRYADLKQASADRCARAAGNFRQSARSAVPPRGVQPVPVESVLRRSLIRNEAPRSTAGAFCFVARTAGSSPGIWVRRLSATFIIRKIIRLGRSACS